MWKNTENRRNAIHTNLEQKKKYYEKQPSISKCTVHCGYKLETIYFKSQSHENWIRDEMSIRDIKGVEQNHMLIVQKHAMLLWGIYTYSQTGYASELNFVLKKQNKNK